MQSNNDLYQKFLSEELILRDHLAVDRTVLANERTLLAYIRTAIGFAAAGVALIHFIDSLVAQITGYALIPVALAITLIGIIRYLRIRTALARLKVKADSQAP